MIWQQRPHGNQGQSSRSACLFIAIHLWCQTVPGFVYLFFPLFSSFPPLPRLSSADRQPRRRGSFCLFDASQSNNEISQAAKLDTIRRVTKHVGGWSLRENLLTHDNSSTHPVTSLWFSPSWPVSQTTRLSVAPCCLLLIMACYTLAWNHPGMLQHHRPTVFLTQINYTAWSTPGSEAWPAKYGWNLERGTSTMSEIQHKKT